jgi:hypothetical protein
MDDLFIIGQTREEVQHSTKVVLQTLANLGWVINKEKSSLVPSQVTKFLRFLINTTGTPHY